MFNKEEPMSDIVNPYQSPETVAVPVTPLLTQGALTDTMLMYLKGASPWLKFIGILGFIGAGLTALWGIIFFAAGSAVGQFWSSIPGLESFNTFSNAAGAAFGILTGMLIIGAAALIFFPSLFLYRFGTKIHSYIRNGLDQDLEQAFKNNKSFWKFSGIICIVYLAIIPLSIIIAVIAAVASAVS